MLYCRNYIQQLSSYNEVPITFSLENNRGSKNAQDIHVCIPEENGEREEGFTTATQILDESHGFQRLHGATIPSAG